MAKKLGPPATRGHYSKRDHELITEDGVPLEPPRPTDIEGRPAVGVGKGDDPLLDALIKEHPERDPAYLKLKDYGTDSTD